MRSDLRTWFQAADPEWAAALETVIKLCRDEAVAPLDACTWKAVAGAAQAHGLLVLLTPRLAAITPPDLAAGLQANARSHAQRNLLFVAETQRLSSAFAAAGIDAVVFKGCLLSQMAHGASHLRQVVDLDFLVRPGQLVETVRVLGTCGYYLDESWTPAIRDGHFEYDCESCLFNTEKGTCVDLHWNFTPRNCALPLEIEEYFRHLQKVGLHGKEVLTFSAEDQLLALSVHGAKHHWQKLEWLYTISTLIRNDPALDFRLILERAEQQGLRHIVASGLLLSRALFQAPLPPFVAQAIDADPVAWEMARISMHWVAQAPSNPPTPMQVRRFHALSRVTWAAKFSYWFGVVATPTEKDYSRPLPRILHPLYFVLRLLRLLGEAVTTPKAAYHRNLATTSRPSPAL